MAKKIKQNDEAMLKHLLNKQFPEEAEQVLKYFDDLSKTEVELLTKCVNKEDLSEGELDVLMLLLNDYRDVLEKVNPDKKIEEFTQVKEVIDSERELLEFLEEQNKPKTITINLKGKEITFDVLPVTDSSVVMDIETHLNIYTGFEDKELQVIAKKENGEKLSQKEKKLAQKVQSEIVKRMSGKQDKVMNTLLINQLRIHNSPTDDPEIRRKIFEMMGAMERIMLFAKIQEMIEFKSKIPKDEFFLKTSQ